MSLPMLARRRPAVRQMPPRVPEPLHRHASPSGPWPWLDLELDLESELNSTQVHASPPEKRSPRCKHADGECECWTEYPQSLFPNWTADRVRESKINKIPTGSGMCAIHHVDVGDDGTFSDSGTYSVEKNEEYWKQLQAERPPHVRLRALFVENLSVSVLQMLGTKYNVEPFFFSSSLNEIPSRYEEEPHPMEGDHVTIVLTFLRATKISLSCSNNPSSRDFSMIDTQLPLSLDSDEATHGDNWVLFLDLLAIHVIRSDSNSTIISYHPTPDRCTTSAQRLHSLVRLAGQSVYWQNIFRASDDPTFVLLTILWYALYAWDHALAKLGEHICYLESSVMGTNDMRFTQDLHKIRAYLLHYASLLDDFRNSVEFLRNTVNPALACPPHDGFSQETSTSLLRKECTYLLNEITRLGKERSLQEKRLKNVIQLVFSSVNIADSKHMKQISYLTMFFLPASFAAAIFGMNIKEIVPNTGGSLLHYLALAVPLTAITIWILVAVQGKWRQGGLETAIWTRLFWPIIMVVNRWRRK